MRRISCLIVLLVVALPLIGCTKDDSTGTGVEPVPPKVRVLRVADRVGVQNKIEVSGRIEPNVEALLSSDIDAQVKAVHVSLNEKVTKGELLVELDSGPGGERASQHVISPIDGRVVELFMEKGERIRKGDELLRVKNMSSVRVIFRLDAMHFEDMRIGQGVRMSVPGLPGLRFIGAVYSIADEIDETDSTFEVQAMVRNPQGKLKAGLKANAIIDTGITKDVHMVPASALVKILDKEVLYVVEDDLAVEKEVVIIRRTDDTLQVLEGLERGDLLVVDNAANLTNKAKVIIID